MNLFQYLLFVVGAIIGFLSLPFGFTPAAWQQDSPPTYYCAGVTVVHVEGPVYNINTESFDGEDATILFYVYDFGDESPEFRTESHNVDYAYFIPGTYIVTVTLEVRLHGAENEVKTVTCNGPAYVETTHPTINDGNGMISLGWLYSHPGAPRVCFISRHSGTDSLASHLPGENFFATITEINQGPIV